MELTDLLELARSNQMLTAGIGTVLFGSAMYLLKGIPLWCYATLRRMLTVELKVTSDHLIYHDLLIALGKHRIGMLARNYSTNHADIVTGYGTSIAWFRGRLLLFDRTLIEKNLKLDERLDLTLFSRDVGLLRALVAEAQLPQDPDLYRCYLSHHGWWGAPLKKRKRPLSTIFANQGTKDAIREKIEWFLANEAWYRRRGIPYKLIFLLHGPPGTGKTSLVQGMTSHFNRALCSVSSISGVGELLRDCPENSFVVIEDIDMLSVTREEAAAPNLPPPSAGKVVIRDAPKADENKDDNLNALQVLINTLDGLGTPHGLILFITTNFRDRLDPALIRKGRVDLELEIGPLDRAETEAMYVAFYGGEHRDLIRRYTRCTEFQPRTGADLQVLFMSEDAEASVRKLRRPHGRRLVAVDPASRPGQLHTVGD